MITAGDPPLVLEQGWDDPPADGTPFHPTPAWWPQNTQAPHADAQAPARVPVNREPAAPPVSTVWLCHPSHVLEKTHCPVSRR